jgi:hypothetical protein
LLPGDLIVKPQLLSLNKFALKLLTENICSGNTKIRDESSIYMRHNFSSVILLTSEILREKPSLPANTISPKSEDNLVLQVTKTEENLVLQ